MMAEQMEMKIYDSESWEDTFSAIKAFHQFSGFLQHFGFFFYVTSWLKGNLHVHPSTTRGQNAHLYQQCLVYRALYAKTTCVVIWAIQRWKVTKSHSAALKKQDLSVSV